MAGSLHVVSCFNPNEGYPFKSYPKQAPKIVLSQKQINGFAGKSAKRISTNQYLYQNDIDTQNNSYFAIVIISFSNFLCFIMEALLGCPKIGRNPERFVYLDSSEEQQQNILPNSSSGHNIRSENGKLIEAERRRLNGKYADDLGKLVNHKLENLDTKMNKMLLRHMTEKQVEEHFIKQKGHYQFLEFYMKTDEKYESIQNQKVFHLQVENQRKKDVLRKHRQIEQMEAEQRLLTKYAIEKEQYEKRVVSGLQKKTRKLGVERVTSAHTEVRKDIEKKRDQNRDKMASQNHKQDHQLRQLKEALEDLKKEKHVNKLEQRKALRDFEKEIIQRKSTMRKKLQNGKEFMI